ncbi:MAG TPA: ribosome biogenesis GTPase Der [Anaerolineales bacterium]|nr:ribosome biogenesis GTPase Der [Anaerolineales bacterium]
MPKPLIALVGRPNVGKSTLFNRLIGERLAVVDDTPGTTRDRQFAEAEWNGVLFDLVDTGGIEVMSREPGAKPLSVDSANLIPEIREQAELAITEADAVIFMTDALTGLTAADYEVADILRRHQKSVDGQMRPPIFLVVNKGDNPERRDEAYGFYELGMGDPFAISAMHGIGTGDLLDALIASLPPPAQVEDDESVKIAIVGRPNVGKSSLLNRLLGEERVIVSPIPGTTRDAIDTKLEFAGLPVTLIDTAGIRRRGHIEVGVEKYSVLRTLRAIDRADVTLLLVDAVEGVTAQDAHIGGMVIDKSRSVVVVVNKWDAIEKDTYTMHTFTEKVRQDLQFLDFVPLLFISAKTGQRCDQVLPTALRVQEERLVRIPTAELNRLVREAMDKHMPTFKSGKRLKIFYASQVNTDPPTFLFHVNDPQLVHFTYRRFLENQIRERFNFLGTPLRLSFRGRGEKE